MVESRRKLEFRGIMVHGMYMVPRNTTFSHYQSDGDGAEQIPTLPKQLTSDTQVLASMIAAQIICDIGYSKEAKELTLYLNSTFQSDTISEPGCKSSDNLTLAAHQIMRVKGAQLIKDRLLKIRRSKETTF